MRVEIIAWLFVLWCLFFGFRSTMAFTNTYRALPRRGGSPEDHRRLGMFGLFSIFHLLGLVLSMSVALWAHTLRGMS